MNDGRAAGPDRRNSFDAVRLVAALAVVLAHQINIAGYTLPGYGQPSIGAYGPKLADAGLYVFFALSGYLVFQSLDADPRPRRFLSARALRIYPGVIVNVLLCVAIGAAVTEVSAAAYWSAPETWRFLIHNTAILATPTEFQLPGVFATSPWPSVNVPLWTLKYEILCYLALLAIDRTVAGLVAAARAKGLRRLVLTGAAAVAVGCFIYERAHPPPLTGGLDTLGSFSAVHVIRFFAVFFSGAAYASWHVTGKAARWCCIALVGLAVLAGPTAELRFVATVLAIGLGAILVGSSRLLYNGVYHRVGDLSYGTYLYAFPIQMFTLTYGLNATNVWSLTILDIALALACAALSWRFVEKPALRLKQGRRQGQAEASAPLIQPA